MVLDLEEVRRSFSDVLARLDGYIRELQAERERLVREFQDRLDLVKVSRFDFEALKEFFDEPYVVIPKRKDEYYVIAPRWLNFAIGWLERQTKGYNIFVVNRYVVWLYEPPEKIKQLLKFPEALPLKVFDGMLLTGKEYQAKAWEKYRQFLAARVGEDRIRIKRGYEFKLIAKLIEDGILPFVPRPVEDEDLRPWIGLNLRSYQEEAWKRFLETGAIGVFWSFGAGKSLFGLYALARIKGKKLVVVPNLTLKEQWLQRINQYIPQWKDEVEVVTYLAYDKVKDREYMLTIFDEVHHLPADTFIRLSTIKTKYRIGLSGSPFREDGRENYIFALTGFPVGLSWEDLIRLQVVKVPTFKVYIVKDNVAKLRKLEELLRLPVKTIIFCDSLEFGQRIAKKFEIPFVYGETKERLEIIRNSDVCVVSRVGDEGISIPEIERVIEVSFLYGSRMQESQRFGRLMHTKGEAEPEHIIIMTQEEYQLYNKRLYAITERGFHIEVIVV
ncbi:MAG: hypothetical protein DRO36_05990 [Candidatus Hecatellales archaeon]|nr:MAG: hypothetical protein DRO36_05990 [Candidatus Hecatellales archaeon]